VGRTFHPIKGEQLPLEVMRSAALVTGQRAPTAWWSESAKIDFFDAKGMVEATLTALGVAGARFSVAEDIEWLQPGRAAWIEVDGKKLGWIGEILPDLLDSYELAAPVAAFQLDVEPLEEAAKEVGTFAGLVRFPAVERDLALLVDKATSSQQIIDAVDSLGIRLLKNVALFDAIQGGKLPEGVQSLGFRFTYQSAERTLTEEEVAKTEERVVNHLSTSLGAKLRDV
jgi:phenylalanyl-tRNA synthetase beta chain